MCSPLSFHGVTTYHLAYHYTYMLLQCQGKSAELCSLACCVGSFLLAGVAVCVWVSLIAVLCIPYGSQPSRKLGNAHVFFMVPAWCAKSDQRRAFHRHVRHMASERIATLIDV